MESAAHGLTRQLADFCLGLKYEDLSAPIIDAAKNALLDLIGVALVGSQEESARMVLKATVYSNNSGEATVMGTPARTTPTVAALVNGHAAHALDYDDFQHKIGTHMSAAVVPAALAVAETLHRSGKELLTAYVVGLEVGCRLGRAAKFAHHLAASGIHSTGFLGHFGAATAAGKLVGLDAGQMRCNFGIVAGHASGIMRSLGTMGKSQNAANAAHNGVLAALLAKQGFTGPDEIFDGKQNIFSVVGANTDAEELMLGLGQQFEISDNTPKVYACSGWRNPMVQAAIALATARDLKPQEIKDVQLWAWADAKKFANYSDPHTGPEAKFSTEHAAAVALIDRAGGVGQFDDRRAQDAKVADLRRKVTLTFDGELKPHQIRLVVHTTDGREFMHFIPAQKGDPKNPFSKEELIAKFKANASGVISDGHVEQINSMVWEIETLKNSAELVRLCRSEDRGLKD